MPLPPAGGILMKIDDLLRWTTEDLLRLPFLSTSQPPSQALQSRSTRSRFCTFLDIRQEVGAPSRASLLPWSPLSLICHLSKIAQTASWIKHKDMQWQSMTHKHHSLYLSCCPREFVRSISWVTARQQQTAWLGAGAANNQDKVQ